MTYVLEPVSLILVIDTDNLLRYSDISRRRKAACTHLDVRRPRSLDIQKSNSGPVAAHTGTAMTILVPYGTLSIIPYSAKACYTIWHTCGNMGLIWLFLERSMP